MQYSISVSDRMEEFLEVCGKEGEETVEIETETNGVFQMFLKVPSIDSCCTRIAYETCSEYV